MGGRQYGTRCRSGWCNRVVAVLTAANLTGLTWKGSGLFEHHLNAWKQFSGRGDANN